jgi:cell division protein YceG involved in septum cleavage
VSKKSKDAITSIINITISLQIIIIIFLLLHFTSIIKFQCIGNVKSINKLALTTRLTKLRNHSNQLKFIQTLEKSRPTHTKTSLLNTRNDKNSVYIKRGLEALEPLTDTKDLYQLRILILRLQFSNDNRYSKQESGMFW